MTRRFFRRSSDPDVDDLNTLLDARRSGSRTSDRASAHGEAGDLVAIAGEFRTLDKRSRAAVGAADKTFDSIWEDMMSAHTTTVPPPLATASARRATEMNQRIYPVPPLQKIGRLQSFLSAAIVAIIITGLVSAAWNLRQGGSGSDDPGSNALMAVTGLDATPEASPAADIDWRAWVTPEECVAEPMSPEEYTDIMRNEPAESVIANRSYTVVGHADTGIANAVAQTGREHEACNISRKTDEKRALESPAFIYISNAGATSYQNADERKMQDVRHGEELSAAFPVQDPAHYISVTTSDAPVGPLIATFDPGNALLLEDGRIAIPATKLFATEPENPFYPGGILIFTNESGEWVIDETLPFCVGDCEAFWAQMGGGRVVYDGTPSATPEATETDANTAWLQPVHSENCMEPYTSNAAKRTTNAVFQPVTPPESSDAEDVARAARKYEACGSGNILQKRIPIRDRWQVYFNVVNSPDSARDIMVRHQLDLARQLSPMLPSQNPADYMHTTNVNLDLSPELVFLPSQAVQLADGRIAIPMSYLIPLEADSTQSGLYSPWPSTDASSLAIEIQVYRQINENWTFDEKIPWRCIGKCDETWDELSQRLFLSSPETTPDALPPTPDTPKLTPSVLIPLPEMPETRSGDAPPTLADVPGSSAISSNDWLTLMAPEECTVEPMSQETYAEIMRNEPVWPSHEYTVVGTPESDMATAAAAVAREHEACKVFRMTYQKWALESPSYIYLSNNGYVAEVSPQMQHLEFVQHSQEVSAQLPNQDPENYISVSDDAGAPSSGFGGDFYLPETALLLSDGRIVIPSTKRFASDPGAIFLPGGMIILTNESGDWLVDEGLNLCVGDCEEYWTKSMGPFAKPTTTPVASPVATLER